MIREYASAGMETGEDEEGGTLLILAPRMWTNVRPQESPGQGDFVHLVPPLHFSPASANKSAASTSVLRPPAERTEARETGVLPFDLETHSDLKA